MEARGEWGGTPRGAWRPVMTEVAMAMTVMYICGASPQAGAGAGALEMMASPIT
jgi:hypothetical protein